jgi:hypothetical protein
MGRETNLNNLIMKALRSLDPHRVENVISSGTPDIEFIGGWIECKVLPAWPRLPHTPVRVPLFTPQQRLWLRRRRNAGGRAWVVLQVGRDYLLIDGRLAADNLGKFYRKTLILMAKAMWTGSINGAELLSIVRQK